MFPVSSIVIPMQPRVPGMLPSGWIPKPKRFVSNNGVSRHHQAKPVLSRYGSYLLAEDLISTGSVIKYWPEGMHKQNAFKKYILNENNYKNCDDLCFTFLMRIYLICFIYFLFHNEKFIFYANSIHQMYFFIKNLIEINFF